MVDNSYELIETEANIQITDKNIRGMSLFGISRRSHLAMCITTYSAQKFHVN